MEQDPPLAPILVAPLLRKVDGKLIELLRALEPAEWDLPTIVPNWAVRDVAAHLLDTATRKLSLVRDRCFVEQVQIRSSQDLVDLVNRLNREGVTVYRRLSPAILTDMMSVACTRSAEFHESLDPFAPAAFPVSWAGEDRSQNWFDTARELTERWHHQQQIRLATNRPGILTRELYHPVLDCFARGLPHHFRHTEAPVGTRVLLTVTGDSGGQWTVVRGQTAWNLTQDATAPAASVTVPEEWAWRMFTKGLTPADRDALCRIEGDVRLGNTLLGAVAIVG